MYFTQITPATGKMNEMNNKQTAEDCFLTTAYRRVVIRMHCLLQYDRFKLRETERKNKQTTLVVNEIISLQARAYINYCVLCIASLWLCFEACIYYYMCDLKTTPAQ